jgi:hypothetical protein
MILAGAILLTVAAACGILAFAVYSLLKKQNAKSHPTE